MAYLDSATVTDILRHRPVYIVTESAEEFRILAVQFAFDDAVLQALQAAFCDLVEGTFSPHDRWHRKEH